MVYVLKRFADEFRRDFVRIPLIVFSAAAFLAGIKCGYMFVPLKVAVIGFGVVFLLAVLPFLMKRRGFRWIRISLVLLFFFGGALRSSYEVFRAEGDLAMVEKAEKTFEVECLIKDKLSVKRLKGRAARYRFSIKDVRLSNGGRFLTLPLKLNWYGDSDTSRTAVPQCGERWQFKGRIYPAHSGRGGPSLVINSGEDSSRCLKSVDPSSWTQRLPRFRNDAARRISIGIEDWEHVAEINQAILLGFKEKIPRRMKDFFVCSGTIHVFAISGLHIALIASVLVFFIASCGVPRYAWVFILTPLLLVYTLATGVRPSAVRAALMAFIYFAAPLFGRRFNALTALAATALVVHLITPSYISDLGSILSFSVMLGLIVLYKPLCEFFELRFGVTHFRIQANLLSASDETEAAAKAQWRARMLSYLAGLCAVSTAAWLSSMPLSACYFGRITPGGLPANLLITPCALMLVTSGVLAYAASFISTALAACFNNAAGFFTVIMIKTARLISGCPYANFELKSFPFWLVWLWFAALLFLAWRLRLRAAAKESGLEWME